MCEDVRVRAAVGLWRVDARLEGFLWKKMLATCLHSIKLSIMKGEFLSDVLLMPSDSSNRFCVLNTIASRVMII